VTGQAAVETEMYEGALEALASDPSVGFVAFDAFPPRLENEVVWAEHLLGRVRELQKETGVAFASVSLSPLSYIARAKRWTREEKLLFLQGHHAATGAIRALVDLQAAPARSIADLPPHPNRAKALQMLRGLSGPLDEVQGAKLLELYGLRRPKELVAKNPAAAAAAARRIGFPLAVKALAPELPHKAKLGGVRLGLSNPTDVEVAAAEVLEAARRAGAKAPQVLVQEMAHGLEVLVGAVVDERFGACITVRPGGKLAEAGEAVFVAAPLTPRQALAYIESQAGRCGLDAAEHDCDRRESRQVIAYAARPGPLSSLEANPLLVTRARSPDALANRSPA
jgi:acyl-CoA synthetase (NDP forming)